jgi:dephospho-CoA kinase
MAKRSIVGLTGQMGCGKSTAANYITEKYSFNEIEYIVFQTSQPQRSTYY